MVCVDWAYLDLQCYSGSLSSMFKGLYKSCPNLSQKVGVLGNMFPEGKLHSQV